MTQHYKKTLSLALGTVMLIVIMPSVANKPNMLSVIMLKVVKLSVVAPFLEAKSS
jgi:hypothetical protein